MLKLMDLISLSGISLTNFKIHCATGANPTPLEAFFDGEFREWQESQNQENFKCAHILSLIHLVGTRWLFAGVYRVHGVKSRNRRGKFWYEYSTSELQGLEHLTGHAIIKIEKKFRASYLRGEKYADALAVTEIRDQRISIGDFPGYSSVLLPYRLLQTVIRENLPSWKSALSNVSGVYVVSDSHNGKLYVGSAYGSDGIWQRWPVYAKNGHGGNKELRGLLKSKRSGYINYLQFSILEVCDLNSNEEYVVGREAHWKNVLRTREFGYNQT